jgi:hypothetical protein
MEIVLSNDEALHDGVAIRPFLKAELPVKATKRK